MIAGCFSRLRESIRSVTAPLSMLMFSRTKVHESARKYVLLWSTQIATWHRRKWPICILLINLNRYQSKNHFELNPTIIDTEINSGHQISFIQVDCNHIYTTEWSTIKESVAQSFWISSIDALIDSPADLNSKLISLLFFLSFIGKICHEIRLHSTRFNESESSMNQREARHNFLLLFNFFYELTI